MYFEQSLQNRQGWKYTYTGEQMLKSAKRLRDQFRSIEIAKRNDLADLLRDPNVSQSDSRIKELRDDIQYNGKLYEECCVYAHEFARNPDREYHLALGDVVFFCLISTEPTPEKNYISMSNEELAA
jgi:hypothetical protein